MSVARASSSSLRGSFSSLSAATLQGHGPFRLEESFLFHQLPVAFPVADGKFVDGAETQLPRLSESWPTLRLRTRTPRECLASVAACRDSSNPDCGKPRRRKISRLRGEAGWIDRVGALRACRVRPRDNNESGLGQYARNVRRCSSLLSERGRTRFSQCSRFQQTEVQNSESNPASSRARAASRTFAFPVGWLKRIIERVVWKPCQRSEPTNESSAEVIVGDHAKQLAI